MFKKITIESAPENQGRTRSETRTQYSTDNDSMVAAIMLVKSFTVKPGQDTRQNRRSLGTGSQFDTLKV
jgi:hypothetical protein